MTDHRTTATPTFPAITTTPDIVIPDVAGMTTLDAAFAYGAAGLYLVPVKPHTKRPGGYLGEGWPSQSVRTGPDIHEYWGERWPRAGVGIHAGRSGLTVVDVDRPDRLDDRVRAAIVDLEPPFQITRRLRLHDSDVLNEAEIMARLDGGALRGHAIFRTPPGRVLGNSLGTLAKGWGEIRGLNGFIVTTPSLHEEADGEYRWLRHGHIPYLPDDVSQALPEGAGDGEAAASDEQVEAFKRANVASSRKSPGLIDAVVRRFASLVEAGEGRHQAACSAAVWIARESAAGLYAAGPALLDLKRAFATAVEADARPRASRTRPGGLDREWAGIVAWAVGQVLGTPADRLDGIRERVGAAARPARVVQAAVGGPAPAGGDVVPDGEHGDLLDPPDPDGEGGEGGGEEAFWASRKILTHIHRSAIAGYASPWAVLGVVLARVLAATSPTVQLPNTVGGYGSLNLFTALVARPGGGKGAAENVARTCVDIDPRRSGPMVNFPTHALGSGEGLAHMFMKRDKPTRADPHPEAYQYNVAALVTVAEIDTLTALQGRQGSTLAGQLRQAAMGEQLGFFYVDKEKRMPVPEHAYRLCLVAGVQPKRAQSLLDESTGGTPQRFVWLPATLDPGTLPDEEHMPEAPEPVVWIAPDWPVAEVHGGAARTVVPLPRAAVEHTIALRREHAQNLGDPLDGHVNFVRLKVAAALAVLEGRAAVDHEDWELSAVVMARSARTRAGIVRELTQDRRESNAAQAEAEAARTIIVGERVDQKARAQVAATVRNKLGRAGDEDGWVSRSVVRSAVDGKVRTLFEPVIEALSVAGEVEAREVEYRGRMALEYRLTRRG